MSEPQSDWDVEPKDVKARLDGGESLTILDVREPHEYEVCNLGGTLIPLGELPDRKGELNADETIIVHCKLGGRSAKAVQLLRDAGFENVHNLRGGITAWSHEVDPSIPTY